jgi:hypothetical protein
MAMPHISQEGVYFLVKKIVSQKFHTKALGKPIAATENW